VIIDDDNIKMKMYIVPFPFLGAMPHAGLYQQYVTVDLINSEIRQRLKEENLNKY
jgi:hypothetical protein